MELVSEGKSQIYDLEKQLDAIALVAKKRDKVTAWLEKIADKNRPRIKADLTTEKERLDRIIKTKIESIDKEYQQALNEYFQVVDLNKFKKRNTGEKYEGDPCPQCGGTLYYATQKRCVACLKEYNRIYNANKVA
ncbi:hypothetical protein G6K72_004442 [Salmonella enterica subsp. enterica serovar Rubislaw]|nr:hypothetical protein [Salmonella enterica subsp. enterica serovar Rubislaw]